MNDLTTGSVFKKIVSFSVPLFIGTVFQQLYSLADAMVVGQFVGKNALAAIGIAATVLFLLVSFVMGLTVGSATVISQLFGAKKMDELKRAVSTTIVYQMAFALPITALGLLLTGPVLRFLNTPDGVFEPAYSYLMIMFGGIIGMGTYNLFSAILRALGNAKAPLWILIGCTLLNVGLDYLFVGVFGWGVEGTAWATLIAQTLSGVVSALYLFKKISFLKYGKGEFVVDWRILGVSVKLGLPTGIQQLLVSVGLFAVQGLINRYGADVIAGCTAAGRLDAIAISFILSIGMTVMIFTGQNTGAGLMDRVRRGLIVSIVLIAVICAAITGIVLLLGPRLIGMFLDNGQSAQAIAVGTDYIRVLSYFYIINGVMYVFACLFRGSGDVAAPLVISIFTIGTRTAAAYLLAGVPAIAEKAIWWSPPIGWGIALALVIAWYLSGRWKGKAIVSRV
jgi:putative MATE family efflux protein